MAHSQEVLQKFSRKFVPPVLKSGMHHPSDIIYKLTSQIINKVS